MTVLSLSGPSLTRFTALTLLACVAAASTLALVGPNVDLPLTDLRQRQAPPPAAQARPGGPVAGHHASPAQRGLSPLGICFAFILAVTVFVPAQEVLSMGRFVQDRYFLGLY
jgi:hypothetical protein